MWTYRFLISCSFLILFSVSFEGAKFNLLLLLFGYFLLWGNREQKQRGITGRKIIASSSSKALGNVLSIFREKFCGVLLFVLFSSCCKILYFSDILSNEYILVISCWAVARIQVLKDASVQVKVQTRPYAEVKSMDFI